MDRLILVFVLGTFASSLAEDRSCREIDGGMECASRSGDSASYTKSISRTGESARMHPLPPLEPLFPPLEPLRPLFPPLRPLFPRIRPTYIRPFPIPIPQQPVPALPEYYRRKRSNINVLLPYEPKGDLRPYETSDQSLSRRKRSVGKVLLPLQPKGDVRPYEPAVPSLYRRKRSPEPRSIFIIPGARPTAPYDLVPDPENYGPYPYDPYTPVGAYLDRKWLKGEQIPLPPGRDLPVPLLPVTRPTTFDLVTRPITFDLVTQPIPLSPVGQPIPLSPVGQPIPLSPMGQPINLSPVGRPMALPF